MHRIAVMQPYFFPYIGYFQLINAVDEFIFYDDVDFIKNGWINRNKVLINGSAKYFTIPCKDVSSNKLIKDTMHGLNNRTKKKLLKKIKFAYSNAPFFDQVFTIIDEVLNKDTDYISDISIYSVESVVSYLGIECILKKSSTKFYNQELDAADRLIDICKREEASVYINPIDGQKLYDKAYFKEKGIDLLFLDSCVEEYKQFDNEFIPMLSMIDIMMFNSPKKISEMLNNYKLE